MQFVVSIVWILVATDELLTLQVNGDKTSHEFLLAVIKYERTCCSQMDFRFYEFLIRKRDRVLAISGSSNKFFLFFISFPPKTFMIQDIQNNDLLESI